MRVLLSGLLAVTLTACVSTTPSITLPGGPFPAGQGNVVALVPTKQVQIGRIYTTRGGTNASFFSVNGIKYREICPNDHNRAEIQAAAKNVTDGIVVASSLKRTFKGDGSIGASLPYVTEVGVGTTSSYEVTIEYKDVTRIGLAGDGSSIINSALGKKCDELIKGRDVYLVTGVHTAEVTYLLTGKVDTRIGAPDGATIKFEIFGNPVTIGAPGTTGAGGSQEFKDEGTYNEMVTTVVLEKIR